MLYPNRLPLGEVWLSYCVESEARAGTRVFTSVVLYNFALNAKKNSGDSVIVRFWEGLLIRQGKNLPSLLFKSS